MASKIMQKTLRELETRYWQALQDKDVGAALELTADPCVIVGAQGVGRVDKSMYERMMRDATWTITNVKLDDEMEVQMFGRNTASVAYAVHEDLMVDGEPVSVDSADSSVWVRSDGAWRCAMHTESLRGDPFGRTGERA